MDALFLTSMLEQFKGAMSGAFGALNGQVSAFLSAAVLFSWSLAVAFWVIEGLPGRHVPLLRKFMLVIAVNWLVQRLPELAVPLMEAAANTGRGLVPGSSFDLSNPGEIASFGLTAADPLLGPINALSSFPDVFFSIPDIIFLLIAWLTVIATFLIVALCVLFAWIEWGLLSAAVYVLLPLAVLGPTNFAAERAVGYVAATAVKFLVLGTIVTFTGLFLGTFSFERPESPGIFEAFGAMGMCLACLVAAVRAPAVAAGLVNGGPALGGLDSLRTILQAGAVAVSGSVVAGGAAAGAAGASAGMAGRAAAAVGWQHGLRLERAGNRVRRIGMDVALRGVGHRPFSASSGAYPMSRSQRRSLDRISARSGKIYDPGMTHAQAERIIEDHLAGRADPHGEARRAAGEAAAGSNAGGRQPDRTPSI